MDDPQWQVQRFEEHRPHLRAVAYRMLGSLTEADDAVQDAWLRFSRSDADNVQNMRAWLTTITGRVCLNRLRARNARPEDPVGVRVPDPVVSPEGELQPEQEALLAGSIGLALLVVLDTLAPAERLAFVLHDMFDLPFDEIARMLERSEGAARQLASRARRRVRGADIPGPERDLARQRRIVDAFLAAVREGDFEALVRLLNPEVVVRIDAGTARPAASMIIRGSEAVAKQARAGLRGVFTRPVAELRPAVVNGTAGVVVILRGQPSTIIGFTIAEDRIVEIDAIADPGRVRRVASSVVSGP